MKTNFCPECGHMMTRNNTCRFCTSSLNYMLFYDDEPKNKAPLASTAEDDDFPKEMFLSDFSLDEASQNAPAGR